MLTAEQVQAKRAQYGLSGAGVSTAPAGGTVTPLSDLTGNVEPGGRSMGEEIIKSPIEALFVRPAVRAGQAIGAAGLMGLNKVTGGAIDKYTKEKYGQDLMTRIQGSISKERDVGGFRVPATGVGAQGYKQAVGEGIENASYLIPAKIPGAARALGGVLPKAAAGYTGTVAGGAAAGYASDVGFGLQKGETVLDALKPGAGTAIGAAIPGLGIPAAKIVSKIPAAGKFTATKIAGLDKGTLETVARNPEKFSAAARKATDRVGFSQSVKSTIDKRLEELAATGKEYQPIRDTATQVALPRQSVYQKLADEFKLGVDAEGKLIRTADSRPITKSEISTLQDFLDTYATQDVITSNQLLNARQALDKLAKYEGGIGKSKTLDAIAKRLRGLYDEVGKESIPGLKEVDEAFAPEAKLLGQVRRDLFDAQGELKAGAISKLANLTGAGKEKLLKNLEKIRPGITEEVNIIRAVEDIEGASARRAGSYVSSGLQLGGIVGLFTGNPWALASILAYPPVIVNLFRAGGVVSKFGRGIVERVLSKVRGGQPLVNEEKEVLKAALSAPKPSRAVREAVREANPEAAERIFRSERVVGEIPAKNDVIPTPKRRSGTGASPGFIDLLAPASGKGRKAGKEAADYSIAGYRERGTFRIRPDAAETTVPASRFSTFGAALPEKLPPGQIHVGQSTGAESTAKWVARIQKGERPPVLVETLGGRPRVQDGHHRLAAYRHLGVDPIPVIDNTGGKLAGNGKAGAEAIRTLKSGDGELTLYHGTSAKTPSFSSFDRSKANTGVGSNALDQGDQVYLTTSKDAAGFFSKLAEQNRQLRDKTFSGTPSLDPGKVLSFRLAGGAKIAKIESMPRGADAARKTMERLKMEGYDAVAFPERGLDTIEGIADVPKLYRNGKPPVTVIVFDESKLMSLNNTGGKLAGGGKAKTLADEAKDYATAEDFVTAMQYEKGLSTGKYGKSRLNATEIGSWSVADIANKKTRGWNGDFEAQKLANLDMDVVSDFIASNKALGGLDGGWESGFTVYRVVPEGGRIQPGDFVFTNRRSAEEFATKYGKERGQTEIVSAKAMPDELILPDAKSRIYRDVQRLRPHNTPRIDEFVFAPRDVQGVNLKEFYKKAIGGK